MFIDDLNLKLIVLTMLVVLVIAVCLCYIVKNVVNIFFNTIWIKNHFLDNKMQTLNNEVNNTVLPYGDVDLGRIVVCAANMCGDGTLILGARHCDALMHASVDLLSSYDVNSPHYKMEKMFNESEQGFIDQHGVFLTRQQAWVVAVNAKQIRRLVGSQCMDDLDRTDIELFSENLY